MKRSSVALVVLAVVSGLLGPALVSAPAEAAARPNTTIKAGPKGLVGPGKATFSFRSTAKKATFQCRLDAKPWKKCRSPKSYTVRADGEHVFKVRAKKHGKVDRTPAVRRFEVLTPISVTQEFADAAAAFYLPDSGIFDVPAVCGNPAVDCPGGMPVSPADQVEMAASRAVVPVEGLDRYDLTAEVSAHTLQSVLLTISLPPPAPPSTTTCTVDVDSAFPGGSSDTWTVHSVLDFVADDTTGQLRIQPGDFSVQGIDAGDLAIEGSGLCDLGGDLVLVMADAIQDALASMLANQPLCAARGPELVALCAD